MSSLSECHPSSMVNSISCFRDTIIFNWLVKLSYRQAKRSGIGMLICETPCYNRKCIFSTKFSKQVKPILIEIHPTEEVCEGGLIAFGPFLLYYFRGHPVQALALRFHPANQTCFGCTSKFRLRWLCWKHCKRLLDLECSKI